MEEAKVLLSTVITELAKDASKAIAKKVTNYFVDREFKEEVDLEYAYEEYLKKLYNTYSKSKSIVYINEAKEMKKFFVPADLIFEKTVARSKTIIEKRLFDIRNQKREIISSGIISDLFEQNSRIVIIGIGGQGKTMHMKHFCTNAIEQKYKIPVFIYLRWFNEREIGEKPFEDLVYENLQDFGFKLKREYFLYSLECGKYVFLLDGYDEVSDKIKNQISIRLQSFSQRYSNNSFIISSRPVDNIYALDEYTVYSLSPLNIKQAAKLILKLEYAEDMKTGFIGELNKGLFEKYYSLASVPLLLSIMYLTYVDNPILPESLVEFYERAFDTMLYGHDRRLKPGFTRDISSGLSYAEFKDVFRAFCFRTYFFDVYSFSDATLIDYIKNVKGAANTSFDEYAFKDDLMNVASMIIRDGLEYTFIHRSFQEYFAASLVSKKMLEDEQRELCLDFINQIEVETIEADSVKDLGKSRNKAIDFLIMLYQIDTKRFEHIVLKPILEKIVKTYKNCRMDLVETVSKYIQFDDENEDDEITVIWLFFLIDRNNKHCLTEKEFNVLIYFYFNIYERPDTSQEKDYLGMAKRQLEYYEYWDEDYFDSFELMNFVSAPGYFLTDEYASFVASILSVFDFCIERYEVLNKNKRKLAFIERINDPKLYT